ncbi:hypothetical protein DIS24_g5239 [Lasiodiplodia hormozganensis]|uniref:Uncharacterized protein n=1 Tax=Lasiodiplodia hormozganensis TaxID=869390 RepID=A0AA40CZ41_9PEZI|nr:hypothetical protein DIS24_g5239 [Lasiodiplodia hormozganensis]
MFWGRRRGECPSTKTNGISPKLKMLRAETVKLLPSQIGSDHGRGPGPLPYTSDPAQLIWSDLKLFFRVSYLLPVLFYPWGKREGDEIYPDLGNGIQLSWQITLTIYQVLFILSLPFCLILPLGWFLIYATVAIALCIPIWMIVNGRRHEVHSRRDIASEHEHPDEYWIFINGVAVGRYWLQANLDRLARIFGRPVTGIHNKTNGLIFDLVQCMIERNLNYSTQDIRDAYKLVKEALMDDQRKKVVLILHSQGALQGSLMIDWLLAELSEDILHKLEVYTFGNAANHFNNPAKSSSYSNHEEDGQGRRRKEKAIRYIEHYVNDEDMVARWGVLHFIHVPNRFMGRLFQRKGTGHLLNQHYLNYMFPLGSDNRVLDKNDFMDSEVDLDHDDFDVDREGLEDSLCELLSGSDTDSDSDTSETTAIVNDFNSPVLPIASAHSLANSSRRLPKHPKVKDFSRLWQYRNGRSPRE